MINVFETTQYSCTFINNSLQGMKHQNVVIVKTTHLRVI